MTTKRFLFPFLLALLVCGGGLQGEATASPSRRQSDKATPPGRVKPSDPTLSVAVNKGTLQLKRGTDPLVSSMRLRLRFADGSNVTGELEPAGVETNADAAGRYERQSFSLKVAAPTTAPPQSQQLPSQQPQSPQAQAQQPPRQQPFKATLELRRYLKPEILVAWVDYEGPALAATEGVQLVMGLDRFARGMAVKRFKLYWTAPVFVSDHRLLGRANQLLLWQQFQSDGYNLLIPLAGDGMVAELGVNEINYRFEFRVSASSYDPKFSPRRVPLFAYAASSDPYRLTREAYQTAFAATGQRGRLRWQKSYPEVFRSLGWCSWNAYEHEVTEEKVLSSVRSLRDKQIPFGFVLVDDGWLSVKNDRLTAFGADSAKFPRGLSGLAATLRGQYAVPHVGVWHTFQGYWSGVDPDSSIGRSHKLFDGLDGKSLPDPRADGGESFYADWYRELKTSGFDFVKVDGQANNIKFTDGLMPLFDSAAGSQRNLEGAARRYFADARAASDVGGGSNGSSNGQGGNGSNAAPGLNVVNCMEMTLENAYNWRETNIARNSDDYLPDVPQNYMDHVYQNAYNAFWTANFAYPDWDMFQSYDPRAEFHAAARAISGGPVYFTDEAGRERPEILRPLAFSDGRLLMLDEPGQVTRDLLLTDTALEPTPLKLFGRVTRPGLSTGFVAAFNVNKTAARVDGKLSATDVEGLAGASSARVAVYQRSNGRTVLLRGANESLPLTLAEGGHDFFTLAPVEAGFAAFGLLDKYLGTAAIVSQKLERRTVSIRLREAGEFGAWLAQAPARVEIDGRALPSDAYRYERGLLRVPQASFGSQSGVRELRITLAPGQR